jgi:hypothetical protein
MGSIGIISLTTRRNRRFFISAEHYPVVKVRPTEVGLDDRCDSVVPSDPLVGGLPAGGRTLIKGSMASPTCGLVGHVIASGGPEMFDCGRDPQQGWWRRGDSNS